MEQEDLAQPDLTQPWGAPWHCGTCGEVVYVARVNGTHITLECGKCGAETVLVGSDV